MTAQSATPSSPDGGSPLEPVVRAAVDRAGYELETLEVVRAGRRHLVRVVVDIPDAPGSPAVTAIAGVDLDGIAAVSRAVAADLDDHEHLFAGAYTLEVTSPGVDRPLTRPRHWRRNRLRLVRARLGDGQEIVGRVGDADADAVTLLVSGEPRRVRFDEVDRAVVEVEFREPPASEIAVLEASDAVSEEATVSEEDAVSEEEER